MKWLRVALEVIGGLSLLAIVAFGTLTARDLSDRVDKATRKDALFILNWGGLPTDQDYKVVSSYRSARSLTGDHSDYFCIELPKFEISEQEKGQWHDGPEKNPVLADALELGLNDARQHGNCVPSGEEVNKASMKLKFPEVVLTDGQATAADIILYDPQKKMLYYLSYKT